MLLGADLVVLGADLVVLGADSAVLGADPVVQGADLVSAAEEIDLPRTNSSSRDPLGAITEVAGAEPV
jgi:hypothetical protein